MIIWGVDPGRTSGGVARYQPRGWWVSPMPPIEILVDMLDADMREPTQAVHVFLEKAQAMPKQGVTSMFNYGTHFGELMGVLIALKVPHTLVRPQTWCHAIHAGTKGGVAKARTLEAVQRLFPEVSLIPERCRKPHSGVTDALAIAEHGRRILRA